MALSNVLHGFLHNWNTLFEDILVDNDNKVTGEVVVVLVVVVEVEVDVVEVEVDVVEVEVEERVLELGIVECSADEKVFDVTISNVEDVEVVSADADSLVPVPLAPEKADFESELVGLFPSSSRVSISDELVDVFECSTASATA